MVYNLVMDNNVAWINEPGFVIPLLLWGLFWKGWALWKSAGNKHLVWFVLLLVVNTVGLLEIGYIFYFYRFDIDKIEVIQNLKRKIGIN